MPANGLSFRAECGGFLNVFRKFMADRATRAFSMRARTICIRSRLEGLFFVFVASLLLCCGDIEANPGPKQCSVNAIGENEFETSDHTSVPSINPESTSSPSSNVSMNMAQEILDSIRQQGERLHNSMDMIKDDLVTIKTEIGHVRERCNEIDKRCGRLESDNTKLFDAVQSTKEDVEELWKTKEQNENKEQELLQKIENMQQEMLHMNEELDNLEGFSRRDNLRMFGVPSLAEGRENYDDCARAVVDSLNRGRWHKHWTTDDIVRAHRVGTSRDGQPKTMIVKFARWSDKMSIITNKDIKDRLKEETGVRIANDLTKRQANIVAEAKREGKVAFFKGGKMQVGPRKADPRTYSEVVKSKAPRLGRGSSPHGGVRMGATTGAGRRQAREGSKSQNSRRPDTQPRPSGNTPDPRRTPPSPGGGQRQDSRETPPSPGGRQRQDSRETPPSPGGGQRQEPRGTPPSPGGGQRQRRETRSGRREQPTAGMSTRSRAGSVREGRQSRITDTMSTSAGNEARR